MKWLYFLAGVVVYLALFFIALAFVRGAKMLNKKFDMEDE